MTDAQLAEQGMKDWAAEEKKIHEGNMKVLTIVESKVSKGLWGDINAFLIESDNTSSYKITTTSPEDINRQDEDYDYLKEVWVDQYCNGGYVGDDFAGWTWIKLNSNEWFNFHYSM